MLHHFLADLNRIADGLLVAVEIGEGYRGLGVAERDHAGFADLVQAAGAFGVGGGRAAQQGGSNGDRGKCFHLIPLAPCVRRVFVFTIGGARRFGGRRVPR
ncbi:hypothetical protein D3C78_1352690 [compost metagenome]